MTPVCRRPSRRSSPMEKLEFFRVLDNLYDAVWLGNELFPAFGLVPFAVLWGVLYAGLASIDRIQRLAATPRTGVPLGVAYSALAWIGPQFGEPIGQGTFTVNGAVQVVLFGAVLGPVYAYSPDVGVE